MKKFKKLFLVVSIVAVLMVMMVVSVSASTLDEYVPDVSSSISLTAFTFDDTDDCNVHFYYVANSGGAKTICFTNDFYQTYVKDKNFDDFEDIKTEFELTHYNSVTVISGEKQNNKDNYPIDYEMFSCPEFIEFCFDLQFNSFDTYISELETNNSVLNIQLEEKNTTVLILQGQVTELNTTITEKDAVITEKDTAISTLQGENTALESDVAGLNMQVADLVQDKAQLNASIKSLEKQLQIKVDKAYAEGLTDADNKISVLPIIIAVAFMLEIIALVVFIVAKLRKNKSRKH